MNPVKKNRLAAFLLLAVLVFTTGMGKQVQGQELQAVSKVESEAEQKVKGIAPAKKIKRIRIGPHPKYTRLLLDFSGPVEYQVNANFVEKKIALIFNNTSITPKVQSRKYRDKNLAAIDVQSNEDQITLTLHLKNSNTRFFHHKEKAASQICLLYTSDAADE